MSHVFSPKIAQMVGVEEAVFLQNIYFWTLKNFANQKNFHDGRHWTYNSVKAFAILFPYWTDQQLRRIISNCVNKGLLLTGNYNMNSYDRTGWYALSDKGQELFDFPICRNQQMDSCKPTNGNVETNKSTYTDIKPDVKPDTKEHCSSDDERPVDNSFLFDQWYKQYPRKQQRQAAWKAWKKAKLDSIAELLRNDITNRIEQNWRFKNKEYIPLPATYLNGERWKDEIIDLRKEKTSSKETPFEISQRHIKELKLVGGVFHG